MIKENDFIGKIIRFKRKWEKVNDEIVQTTIPIDSTLVIGKDGLVGIPKNNYDIKTIAIIKQKH